MKDESVAVQIEFYNPCFTSSLPPSSFILAFPAPILFLGLESLAVLVARFV